MLRVATTTSQVGSWSRDRPGRKRARRSGGGRSGSEETRSARGCDSPLFLGGAALPAERDGAAGSARARASSEAARAGGPHPRAHAGDGAPTRWRVETRNGPCSRGGCGARRQLEGFGLSRLPVRARLRLEPHRAHGARPRGASRRSAGPEARRSSTVERSSTTCGRRTTAGSLSGGAAAQWASTERSPDGRRSTRRSSRRTREWLCPVLPAAARPSRDARLGWADRRLPHASPDLRESWPRASRVRLHGERRRAERISEARSWHASRSTAGTSEPRSPSSSRGRKLFPPEPFRYVGGSLIRRALLCEGRRRGRGPGAGGCDRVRRGGFPALRPAAASLARSAGRGATRRRAR